MPDLVPFQFNGHDVPTIRDDQGEPWWKAVDVCEHCYIKNVSKACERLDSDEKTVITISDSAGRPQEMLIVNEAGLYRLVLSSRKPEAKLFKRWVIHDVLPQIRKTGRYDTHYPKVRDPAIQMLIDMAVQLDEARTIANEAKHVAAIAEAKADLALADAHRMTLEEFVLKNGLLRQFPTAQFNRYTAWLKTFCQSYGLPILPAPVYGKSWDHENEYPLGALAALLRHEQTRPRQVALVHSTD
jgi:prophage antirepressor-like protein